MSNPDRDPATAEAEEQDADFAEEHDEVTLADEQGDAPGMQPDEATPRGISGMDEGRDESAQ